MSGSSGKPGAGLPARHLVESMLRSVLNRIVRPRAWCVAVHRWAGLCMAGFLLLAGLTGSLLAWRADIDLLLSPDTLLAPAPDAEAKPQSPMALRDNLLARYPAGTRIDWIPLNLVPGRSLRFDVDTGQPLANNLVTVDPYSGRVLDTRRQADIGQGSKNLMDFIYRLHSSLALDTAGVVLMGVVSLVWTIDCFIGAYLTLPPRQRRPAVGGDSRTQASWFARWRPAWVVRWRAGPHRLDVDLHRAFGLWPWALLFVLAWSSVSFSLPDTYGAVMNPLLPTQAIDEHGAHIPARETARPEPDLAPQAALDVARRLISMQASSRGFTVTQEEWLGYDPRRGVYTYVVTSSRDVRSSPHGQTRLFLDGDSGAPLGLYLPTAEAPGDTFRTWIGALHTAALWGRPMQVAVCALGLAVAVLSVTGVRIWWRKRRARRHALRGRQRERISTVPPAPTGTS